MKIRIFALAKDLEMDSKELIEACAHVGVVLKNSPLASISPEERDKVMSYLKDNQATPQETNQAPIAPVREPVVRNLSTKVPELKVAPRPQTSRLGVRVGPAAVAKQSATETAEPEPQEETETSVAASAETEEAAEAATVEESTEETTEETTQQEEELTTETLDEVETETVAEVDATETEETEVSKEVSAAEPVPPKADRSRKSKKPKTPAPEPKAPLRPEDYIPASGTSSKPSKPAASDAPPLKAKRSKSRPGPALPNLPQLGKFKGPVAGSKPAEAPAQKPEIRLPVDIMSSPRPLDSILKKNAEDRKGKRAPIEVTPDADENARGTRTGKQAGAGLSASRKERQDRRKKVGGEEESSEAEVRIRGPKRRKHKQPVALKTSAEIEPPITVRSLSEALGRPANLLIKSLFMDRGVQVNINSSLDEEIALELAMDIGVDLKINRPRDIEEELAAQFEMEESEELLETRPPIITVLGHVDHGKTTLVDKLREANVASGESGGITQHIAAYQVEHNGQKLTFVDTPGHAAFGEMRARGANVTDIVVLVVAGNDGVMPQTIEAISHAKAADVPIVVAMNKMDLVDINEQRVLQELSTHGVLPVEWGGDTEVVRTSGLTGKGLDDLLETLLLTAELHGYKSNPNGPAQGTCLEAFRDEGRGTIAWLIVQRGTLNVGDVAVCGAAHGRIRAIYSDHDEALETAPPSTPVKISGLDVVPNPGDKFQVLPDLESARLATEERRNRGRAAVLSDKGKPFTLEDILDPAQAGLMRDLPLIIKSDTPGSLEAIRHELNRFSHPEVRVKVLHQGVGGVNESDVYLAAATGAIIVAFHVVPEERARVLADREGVEVRTYTVIYEVIDQIKLALEGLLRPEMQQIPTGRAIVLRTFDISRFGRIAGCRVLSGNVERNSRVRLIRENKILNEYGIASLKREKDDVRDVREGMECGIRLDGYNDIKEGDLLEAYRVEEIKRKLDD